MSENDFIRRQQAAVERMRELNSRSVYGNTGGHRMPPVPPFVKIPNGENARDNNFSDNATSENQSDNPNENAVPPENEKTKSNNNKDNNDRDKDTSFLGGLNLPFLDIFKKDGDMTLIIGLLLILLSEKADKKLLFALIYILLK